MPIIDSNPKPKADTQSADMPNLQHIIQQTRDSQAWDFTTKEGLCAYTNACVVALHDVDSDFGHLTKTEGQNHCVDPIGRNCATDVAMYLPTGQVVDFIESAGYGNPPPPNNVCWNPGPNGEYPPSSWIDPVPDAGGTEPPVDDQQAQLNHIENMCEQMQLYLSNMNEQIALMGGEINRIRADQNLPYEGQAVLPPKTLTLTVKRP